jgi:hypothetical protein
MRIDPFALNKDYVSCMPNLPVQMARRSKERMNSIFGIMLACRIDGETCMVGYEEHNRCWVGYRGSKGSPEL